MISKYREQMHWMHCNKTTNLFSFLVFVCFPVGYITDFKRFAHFLSQIVRIQSLGKTVISSNGSRHKCWQNNIWLNQKVKDNQILNPGLRLYRNIRKLDIMNLKEQTHIKFQIQTDIEAVSKQKSLASGQSLEEIS